MSDDHHFWHKPVPDPDLEIRCGGVRGGGWGVGYLQTTIFRS